MARSSCTTSRIYVYPLRDENGELSTVDNLEVAPALRKLYGHLVERGCIRQLENFDPNLLHIFSRDILRRIREGDASWQGMVPQAIAEVIKGRSFFGYSFSATGSHPPRPSYLAEITGSIR
jgi:hypothetical protein